MEPVAAADVEDARVRREGRGTSQQAAGLEAATHLVHEAEAVLGEVERVVVVGVDAVELGDCGRGSRYTSPQRSQRTARKLSGDVRYSKSSPTPTGSDSSTPQMQQATSTRSRDAAFALRSCSGISKSKSTHKRRGRSSSRFGRGYTGPPAGESSRTQPAPGGRPAAVELRPRDRIVQLKVVYYGPAVCGKTTNLQMLHAAAIARHRGELITVNSQQERTILFDLLPLRGIGFHGFDIRFQLVAVPGQAPYAATRRLVMRGTDAVVFVANSAADRLDENVASLAEMNENLKANGIDPETIPIVFQYNKRDLPEVLSVEQLIDARSTRAARRSSRRWRCAARGCSRRSAP